jgi:hypothetical protein
MIMPTLLRAGLVYFTLVFAAGFLLGTLRVLLLVPALGVRSAELLEMPLMLAVIYFAARFVVRHHPFLGTGGQIGTGLVALALLLLAEFTFVLGLRGLSLAEYLESRDPVAFAAYVLSLLLYGAMPRLLGRGRS